MPTYNFSIRVSDCSGSLTVSCFGEIGQTILGINARKFFEMHEDIAAVKDLTMNQLHQNQLCLVVRAKASMHDGNDSVRYTAVRATKHSYKQANESLLAQLKGYAQMPDMAGGAAEAEDVAFF